MSSLLKKYIEQANEEAWQKVNATVTLFDHQIHATKYFQVGC
jgi:hypothetical protein